MSNGDKENGINMEQHNNKIAIRISSSTESGINRRVSSNLSETLSNDNQRIYENISDVRSNEYLSSTLQVDDASVTKELGENNISSHSTLTDIKITSSDILLHACSKASPSSQAHQDSASFIRSIGSLVCRICHNAENPEKLISPCSCKGSLNYVHVYCLEYWMCTSGKTTCELCHFQYKTIQYLRYTCTESLRMWYSRSVSRRSLQEDCQLFSLLTLVVFGIIGPILVGIKYFYFQNQQVNLTIIWTQVWLIVLLFLTLTVYCANVYIIVRSQLSPWYRWWQSARDIKLILENRRPTLTKQKKSVTKHVEIRDGNECTVHQNQQLQNEQRRMHSGNLSLTCADEAPEVALQTVIFTQEEQSVATDNSPMIHVSSTLSC